MTGSELAHLRYENAALREENQTLRAENERLRQKLKQVGFPQISEFGEDSRSVSVEPPFPVVPRAKRPPKESIDIKPPVNDIAPNTKRRSWVDGKIIYNFEQAHDFDPPKPHPKLQAAAGASSGAKPKRKIVAKSVFIPNKPPPPTKQNKKPPVPKPPMARKPNETPPELEEEEGSEWKKLPPTFSKVSVDSTESFHKFYLYGSREDSTDSGKFAEAVPAKRTQTQFSPPIKKRLPQARKPPPKPQSMHVKRPPPSKVPKPPSRKSMPPTRSTPKPNKAPPPIPHMQNNGTGFREFPTAPAVRANGKKPLLKKKSFNPPPPKKTGPVQMQQSSSTSSKYYSPQQLREKSIPGLDYNNAEKYLCATDFLDVFGMGFDEFSELKGWKQTQIKKKVEMW